ECGCGDQDCPAAAAQEPLGQVVIEVIAEAAAIEGTSENPGYAPGFGAVPVALLREMATTAQLKPVPLPAPVCEDGYRPSAALARFVRCRDLTCRFPGCDVPADVCDVDIRSPTRWGRRTRQTSSCCAGFTTCSKRSTPAWAAGPTASCPTEP